MGRLVAGLQKDLRAHVARSMYDRGAGGQGADFTVNPQGATPAQPVAYRQRVEAWNRIGDDPMGSSD
jgi:hypothetical protein